MRGDSSESRARVTVSGFSGENGGNIERTTNGTFEGQLEQKIKARAEGNAARDSRV